MRIERNHQAPPVVNLEKSIQAAPAPGPAAMSFEDSRRINQALAATSTVRPDQVARAKALLADPNYPSEKQSENVAHLLARHLSREKAIG